MFNGIIGKFFVPSYCRLTRDVKFDTVFYKPPDMFYISSLSSFYFIFLKSKRCQNFFVSLYKINFLKHKNQFLDSSGPCRIQGSLLFNSSKWKRACKALPVHLPRWVIGATSGGLLGYKKGTEIVSIIF